MYQLQVGGLNGNAIVACNPIAKFQPYAENSMLGIRSLDISSNNQYIAAGFFDSKLRFYNQLSWKEIFAFDHQLMLNNDNNGVITDDNTPADLNIYVENEGKDGSVYDVGKKPFKLPALPAHQLSAKSQPPSSEGAYPKVGISLVAISYDSRFVATKSEQHPLIVWIWDL